MRPVRLRLRWLLVPMALLAVGVWWLHGRRLPVRYATVPVDRGDVLQVVGATGALEAVTTVQVGSQVSGTIAHLYADFNSVVHKGEVIARLEPSLFEARLRQAEANLTAAEADVERARANVEDTRQKLERARQLAAKDLVAPTDLDTAQANYDAAQAQQKANEAAVSQARATVNQARVDLSHTVIATPIDGVVISRNVDVGQTVAASFQAPVLFVIANDLAQMRVKASVDEADVGQVRDGEDVTFRVDAYPEREFRGRVEQVRLNPTVDQNVVSYDAIVAVDNSELLLRPGMTATVSIITQKAENVLRVPAAALRFRPEGFEWPGSPPAGTGTAMASAGAAEGGPGGPGRGSGRQGWRGRMEAAGDAPTGRTGTGGGHRPANGEGSGRARHGEGGGRPTVLFALGPDGTPTPVPVRVGLSDGQFVEVRSGLDQGSAVVVGTQRPGAAGLSTGPPPSTNPFSPQFRRRQR
jgi:HlyD family secretion protein